MMNKMKEDSPVDQTNTANDIPNPEIPDIADIEALADELLGQNAEEIADENTEEVDLRDERIIALEAIIEDLRDKHLRATAEAENIRKRADREKADALKFGAARLARDLLGVADSLQRALATVTDETRTASGDLIAGLEMTERELLAAFRRHEIVPIDPTGEKFDPNLHEAMAQIPGTGQPNGTVVDVIQPGFQINGRLLRPARVAIATGSTDKPSPDSK